MNRKPETASTRSTRSNQTANQVAEQRSIDQSPPESAKIKIRRCGRTFYYVDNDSQLAEKR